MKQNTYIITSMVLAAALLLNACTKDIVKNLNPGEAGIYITNYDSSVSFNNFTTFSISDSVAVVQNGELKEKAVTAVDEAYVNAVKANMQERGYTLVNHDQEPDLGITITRVTNTSTGIISYPSFWGFYDSFYDPFFWGYGGYNYFFPYSFSVYEVREGAVTVDMVNLKDAAVKNKIDGVWSGIIRGGNPFDRNSAVDNVDALFAQSPYLQTNQ